MYEPSTDTSEVICIRHILSHAEMDLFANSLSGIVLSHMNEIIELIAPITVFDTRIRKVTFSGEPFTLIEVKA